MVVSVDNDVAIPFSSSSWFVILVMMGVIAYDGSLFNTSSRLSMALFIYFDTLPYRETNRCYK